MAYYAKFRFKYPGQGSEEDYEYKIPMDVFTDGVRDYIGRTYSIVLDGMDGDVLSMFYDISGKYGDDDQYCSFFDDVEEAEQEYFRKRLEEDAFEAFKDDWEYNHSED